MAKYRELFLQTRREHRQKNMELILDRLKEVGIGLITGGLFSIVAGWLYFVTVMAR